jgi:hypothetical protein
MLNWRAEVKSAGSPKFREAEAKAVEAEGEGEGALNAVAEAAVETETEMDRSETSTPSTKSILEILLEHSLMQSGMRSKRTAGPMSTGCEVAVAQQAEEQEEEEATMMLEGVDVVAADGRLPKLKSTEMRPPRQEEMAAVVHEMVPALEEEHTMNDSFAVPRRLENGYEKYSIGFDRSTAKQPGS